MVGGIYDGRGSQIGIYEPHQKGIPCVKIVLRIQESMRRIQES